MKGSIFESFCLCIHVTMYVHSALRMLTQSERLKSARQGPVIGTKLSKNDTFEENANNLKNIFRTQIVKYLFSLECVPSGIDVI